MRKDERGSIVDLKGRSIPRDSQGDPAFGSLWSPWDDEDIVKNMEGVTSTSVLSQFTPEEVVQIVNRYIYQQEYQRTVHRRRAQVEAERAAPLRRKIEEMFGIRRTQATEAQMRMAELVLRAEAEGATAGEEGKG